jgi:TolB-like protein/tetratricopeptide (TPR) repeat protein
MFLKRDQAMSTIYSFGPFRLDGESEILFRGTEPTPVGQRAVALLRVLVEQPGMPVSKNVLMEAAWPGLVVEESNLPVQIAALRRVLGREPGGENWIETLPRRGYRFRGPAITAGTATPQVHIVAPRSEGLEPRAALALPDRPSIAVLPFTNIGGDPEQEYFADGMVEEIITALSRMRWLFVIARNSSFTYKGRAVDVKQVGHELGVRYVLEGSVRKADTRVRITGQLIDAVTGAHLWAERFDGTLHDIFDLQDHVATSVAGAIAPKLEQAETERAKRKPTENLNAYDCYLRGMESHFHWTQEATTEALRHFERAIEIDTEFALAYAMAANCYRVRKINNWMIDRDREIDRMMQLAQRAARLGKDDAVALYLTGYVLAQVGSDLALGTAMIDRALTLDPNLARAWLFSGWVRIYLGEPEMAIEHMERALRLSPLDPFLFSIQNGIAAAHFLAGRYDAAASWAENSLREQPIYPPIQALRIAAASRALAGQIVEARTHIARVHQIDPALRVSGVKDMIPFRRSEDAARYVDGLRKAGLPE